MTAGLEPEDAKIVTLARTARTRGYPGPAEGAAARDDSGRTYAAATVRHEDPSLTTSALRGALSAAVSSGARRFEAFALVADDPSLSDGDRALLRELARGVTVLLATPDGAVVATAEI
ncbi:MAG TPA: cytidine deaminase [Mycobacteriales bacterium]